MITVSTLSHAQARTIRTKLIERGIDPHRVSATPMRELEALERSTRLTIVADVDAEIADDAFSTRYFLARMRGEQGPDFDHSFDGLGGGDGFGGSAA